MKKCSSPLPALVAGIVVVATLATILVEGGWFLWIPALLALAVTAKIWDVLDR